MNLLDRLREQIKDDRDIEAVLLSASGSSGYCGLPNGWVEIYSGAANSTPYVSLKFRSGRIAQLKIGQPLSSLTAQDALVDRARFEIAHIHGYKVVERHLLASRKLTGSYGHAQVSYRPEQIFWFDVCTHLPRFSRRQQLCHAFHTPMRTTRPMSSVGN